MFDQLVVSNNQSKTHKSWTVTVSALIQLAVVVVLILIPLIYTEALPKELTSTFLVAPAPPPPPPPPVAIVKTVRPKFIEPQRMVAPTVIPKKVEIVKDEAPDVAGTTGGFGVPGGVAGGILGGIVSGAAPPPPPKPVQSGPVRIGGNVMQAKAIDRTQPVYPAIARAAHVQGTVVLHAIIAKDGTVQQLQLVSGPPLLVNSAMDAVRQWRYQPTQLNGEAVEVDTTIQVVFTLGG
jgi:periplasmic protein TonB